MASPTPSSTPSTHPSAFGGDMSQQTETSSDRRDCRDWQAPVSSSMTVHGVRGMGARATPLNAGAVSLRFEDGNDYEAFGLTVFTEDAALSVELATAINAVLAKYGRLCADISAEQVPSIALDKAVA